MTALTVDSHQATLMRIRAQLDTLEHALQQAPSPLSPRAAANAVTRRSTTVRAAQRLNDAAGILATSVLLDSAVEHYRGSFENKAMYTPLIVSALTLAASVHGTSDHLAAAHRTRQAVYGAGALTGLAGTAFHIYNVMKRPGALTWQNLFYGAPIGAPMAILLAGLLGSAAEQVRDNPPGRARVLDLPAGRLLAFVSGAGLCGTAGEAALLHFRGAFHNPAMFAPVTIPPIGGALLLNAAFGAKRRNRKLTRWWMRLTGCLGVAGVGFHIWGVQRNMGGWRNWRQNVLNGPPIPAPPSFTGLAVAGLAALGLLEDHPDG